MLNRQDVMEFILDHYERPRHRGALSPATVVMKGGNPTCGDVVTIFLQINPETQRIERVTFTGEGCTISQAAASVTTEKAQGQPLDEVRGWHAPDVLADFGDGVMGARRRCATLALHTLHAALAQVMEGVTPAPDRDAAGLRFEAQAE